MSETQAAVEQVAAGWVGAAARRRLALVALLCAILFAFDAWIVLARPLAAFDEPVELWVQRVPWGPVAALMSLTNSVAGYWQAVLGAVVILLLSTFERRGAWLMLIGSLGSLIDNVLKDSFGRHRPTPDLVRVLTHPTDFSFPSGHAVFYTWLLFMLAFALAPRVPRAARPILWALAGLGVLVACLGRVWAGAHWPSDVLGGFLLGLGWSAFVLWLPERWLPSPGQGWLRVRRLRRRGRAAGAPAP